MNCESLDTNGYVVVPGVLRIDELSRWREVIGRFRSAVARNLLSGADTRELIAASGWRCHVEQVLGSTAKPVRALLFDKRPGENWAVGWHQDTVIAVDHRPAISPPGYTGWSEKQGIDHVRPPVKLLEEMLTVRLCLDDNALDNGALRVLSGSHRHGLLTPGQIDQQRATQTPHACVAQAGDALLMRPLLLHSSPKAKSVAPRRVVHIEFSASNLPEPLLWPDW